jgi:hypothetical protein
MRDRRRNGNAPGCIGRDIVRAELHPQLSRVQRRASWIPVPSALEKAWKLADGAPHSLVSHQRSRYQEFEDVK